jgi:hypothetical protein
MNIKITKKQYDSIKEFVIYKFIFGSHLHGTNNEESDRDVICIIDNIFDEFTPKTLGKYLPNQNTFQYDDLENNVQNIYMTETQFFNGLFSGDANIVADIVLLSPSFKIEYEYTNEQLLFMCRTYKIIKSYLGMVKRDLKYFDKNPKKQKHCIRGLYMTECLINNILPNVIDIKKSKIISRIEITERWSELRDKSNKMFEKDELTLYPIFKESNEIMDLLVKSNNIKEFSYN